MADQSAEPMGVPAAARFSKDASKEGGRQKADRDASGVEAVPRRILQARRAKNQVVRVGRMVAAWWPHGRCEKSFSQLMWSACPAWDANFSQPSPPGALRVLPGPWLRGEGGIRFQKIWTMRTMRTGAMKSMVSQARYTARTRPTCGPNTTLASYLPFEKIMCYVRSEYSEN